ncbi:hypothetical protein VTN96DRAFT_9574 [Rasamsonia emersonii]
MGELERRVKERAGEAVREEKPGPAGAAGRGPARLVLSGENSGAAKVPRCREAWARGSQRKARPAALRFAGARRCGDAVDASRAGQASGSGCSGGVGQRTSWSCSSSAEAVLLARTSICCVVDIITITACWGRRDSTVRMPRPEARPFPGRARQRRRQLPEQSYS